MSAGGVVQEPWNHILEEVVVRMSRITLLASRFLNFYIESIFSSNTECDYSSLIHADYELSFNKEFFEHLFKIVTWDTQVDCEPTLQFIRCIWLHALLRKHDAPDIGSLDQKQLWEIIRRRGEIKARAEAAKLDAKKKQKKKENEKKKKQNETKVKEPHGDKKKENANRTIAVIEEEEEEEETDDDQEEEKEGKEELMKKEQEGHR